MLLGRRCLTANEICGSFIAVPYSGSTPVAHELHLVGWGTLYEPTEIANPRSLPSFPYLTYFASLIPLYTALACCLIRICCAELALRSRMIVVSRELVY